MKLAATKQLSLSSPAAMHGHFASDGGVLAVIIIRAGQVEGSEAATDAPLRTRSAASWIGMHAVETCAERHGCCVALSVSI